MQKLQGGPVWQNFDAHVVPVIPLDPNNPNEAVYNPAEAGDAARSTYMELVVFDEYQALPRFIVDVARSSIPRSLVTPGPIRREVPLQYARLFAGITSCPELQTVLVALRDVVALKAHAEQGDAQRQERQRRIKGQMISASAEKYMRSSSDVTIGDQIGEGAFGVVFQARARYMGGLEVAVKRLKSPTPELETALKKETLVMMRVSFSPFIVRAYGMQSNPLGIIMELVKHGSLHDLLRARALTVDEQFNLCRSVTVGLKTLHDNAIVHCDLKGKNILVDILPDGRLQPKITCFRRVLVQSGTLASSVDDDDDVSPRGFRTHEYMAPELHSLPAVHTAASDTYAAIPLTHAQFFGNEFVARQVRVGYGVL
jgi:hypothetical protein